MFDVTNATSFENLHKWIDCIDYSNSGSAVRLLVGNKCDLVNARQVTTETALAFAEERQMSYIETSCKDANNVRTIFQALTEEILGDDEAKIIGEPISLRPFRPQPTRPSCGC
eukprot:TRINITY_DN6111_c0_g2_i1.p1 TRINITY_DN6111_c0_g2~~TRINITY_DN6111_c0_g2_i1.p1  ORF type:complete len:113 (+),score=32.24 TRINITY_DN6111_c0_g2_i1:212-550(+)